MNQNTIFAIGFLFILLFSGYTVFVATNEKTVYQNTTIEGKFFNYLSGEWNLQTDLGMVIIGDGFNSDIGNQLHIGDTIVVSHIIEPYPYPMVIPINFNQLYFRAKIEGSQK